MGVDHTTTLQTNGAGRESVRISSKKTFTHGLFIADIAHMPGTICGAWPACKFLFFMRVEEEERKVEDNMKQLSDSHEIES